MPKTLTPESTVEEVLSANLLALREAYDISQRQVAKDIGCHQASVSNWETGRTIPNVGMLVELASYYEVTVDSLLGRSVRRRS